jgi:hypothetical protein
MGFDSLRAAELHLRLVRLTGLPLSITMLWNYPNILELAAALLDQMNSGHQVEAGQPFQADNPHVVSGLKA